MKTIRVLHVLGGLNMGGIENFIMNIYREINKNKIQFDFLIHQDDEQFFEKEIKKLGGNVYRIPSIKKVGYFNYKKNLKEFYMMHDYKIVHSHYNTLSGVILMVAKHCNIPIRIAHSHTSYPKVSLVRYLYQQILIFLLRRYANVKYACSIRAGEWLYGKKSKFEVINNGILGSKYLYDRNIRKKIRNDFNIDDNSILIGHVGRFSSEKNHDFLIDIFLELYKKNKNYKLFLIGEGDLENSIKAKVEELNLKKSVQFLGVRQDVNEILQALDIFVLPSLFEGLPVTLVEAQAAGLKCFVSDRVTKEIDFKDELIEFISLEKDSRFWSEEIEKKQDYSRERKEKLLKNTGYDVIENSKILEKKYITLLEERK